MVPSRSADPTWLRTPADLDQVARRLARSREVALDTEGDSLHHYPARLALLQLADERGSAWLVDTLAIGDLSPLVGVFGSPGVVTVLHAGDNDLVLLKRGHGLPFVSIFDTSVAARFLGAPALGLDVLLAHYLGVELPPSRQKDDWSARPLTPAQERYAAADVQYLIPLKARLVGDLVRAGRLRWVEEECEALALQVVSEISADPDAYAALKGARELSPRGLAALRELYAARERLAREMDRPPFKILSNEILVAIASCLPRDATALGAVPGFTPRGVGRWAGPVLTAVDRALTLSDSELPTLARTPRLSITGAMRRRIEALRQWRSAAAPRVGLGPGVLLPNRLIDVLAETAPADRDALTHVEGLRGWRVEEFGDELLRAMALGPKAT